MTFGGAFINYGTLTYDNSYTSLASTMSATGIFNYGSISVTGSGNLSTLSTTGSVTNDGNVNVNGGGVLSASGAYTQYGGATTINGTLSAPTVNVFGGNVVFGSALTSTSTETALNLQSGGGLYFDAGVSSAQMVNFKDGEDGLYLQSAGTFNGAITGFQTGDSIQLLGTAATSLAYSGCVLDVCNGSTQVAALHVTGSYTTASFNLVGVNNGGSWIYV